MNKIQKKIIINTYRKQKEKLDRVHERNFQNSRNFLRNFQFAYCGSSDNPSAFIEKGKQRKWLKISLVKLGYVMCQKATLYQNAQIKQDMMVLSVWSKKRSYFN